MTMERRAFLRLAGAAALGPTMLACGRRIDEASGWTGYDGAMIIDALAGPIQFNIPQEGLPLRAAALEHVRSSGITALNLTVNARAADGQSAFQNTMGRIAAWEAEVATHPDVFTLVRDLAELRAARADGRLGLILGFQDTVPFEHDLAAIDDFFAAGVRIVQLTYNVENLIGSGCLAPTDSGLTALGHEAVARLEERGMLIDLSHCGPRTTLDAIESAIGPVSITHSGCNALFRHPRSKDDATLRRLAERGGVVGIYLMPFLNAEGPPTADDVVRHIEHALDVCGEDHVGIGSDQGIVPLDVSGDFPEQFAAVSAQRSALGIAAPREDTIPYVPELNHPRRLETIGTMMDARGHSSRVIEKVLGTNFERLFGEVWR